MLGPVSLGFLFSMEPLEVSGNGGGGGGDGDGGGNGDDMLLFVPGRERPRAVT